MLSLTVDAIRRRETAAIAGGTPAIMLMERAGAALARAVFRLLRARGSRHCLFVAGRGNNGGDAFVAARLLEAWGVSCGLRLTGDPEALKGAAREAWDLLRQAEAPAGGLEVCDSPQAWQARRPLDELPPRPVVVDALLGTGARGAPTGVVRDAVAWINRAAGSGAAVVAVDLPSGLDADTGVPDAVTVQADLTVTFDAPKRGFLNPAAWPALGRVETVDIGLADLATEPATPPDTPCDCLTAGELAPRFGRRPRESHKGDYGHLLVIGGSAGFAGAPALTALAALRSGAGLVSARIPDVASAAIAALAPEAMAHPAPARAGCLDLAGLTGWKTDLAPFDAVVAGPGLGTGEGPSAIIEHLLAHPPARLLLDADALTIIARRQPPRRLASTGACILTPHPGEAARLLGTTVQAVQADRPAAVRRLADATDAVVVLKGCGTLVCAPGGRPALNLGGNPGMASGGSGDVLAGIIGALWGQGLDALDAARLGVYWHATAGDLAAWHMGERALLARDIAAHLGEAGQAIRESA